MKKLILLVVFASFTYAANAQCKSSASASNDKKEVSEVSASLAPQSADSKKSSCCSKKTASANTSDVKSASLSATEPKTSSKSCTTAEKASCSKDKSKTSYAPTKAEAVN